MFRNWNSIGGGNPKWNQILHTRKLVGELFLAAACSKMRKTRVFSSKLNLNCCHIWGFCCDMAVRIPPIGGWKRVMKHWGGMMKSFSAGLLIKLLHLLTLTEWDRKYVSARRRPHSRFKRLKYSGGEGRHVKPFHSHFFFFSNWKVSWQDGDILSSSHFFLFLPLWSRVALHHACQREVSLEQLLVVVVGGDSTRNLNPQESIYNIHSVPFKNENKTPGVDQRPKFTSRAR